MTEIERINEILISYGWEYPLGWRGVADLAFAWAHAQDELHQIDPARHAAPKRPAENKPPGMRLDGR